MKNISVNVNAKLSHISKNIFGHFSEHLGRCIYEGIYVGEGSSIPNTKGIRNDVAEALKQLEVPVLRWPGGCFADEYHWMDGIGKKSSRKKMINTHWGGVTEDNSFGTHEFFDLCELIGCEPYIAGNLGSGTVQEMSQWIEYMTFGGKSPMSDLRKKNGREEPWKLKYFGIGNESWGCGGNMRPQYYADLYRQYQTYCRNYDGNELYKVACGPNADDYSWTEELMKLVKPWHAKAISLHYYTLPTGDWGKKGDAVEFTDEEYYSTIKNAVKIDEIITRHLDIMSSYDPKHEMGLIVDEWGNWFDVEKGTNPGFLYQQSTVRDAVTAAINFDIFIRHSDRIVMANIAQAVNVLQSVILTEGEKMVKTPTYHVFDLYRPHMEAERLFVSGDSADKDGVPTLSCSASVKDDTVFFTVTNADLNNDEELEVNFGDYIPSKIKAEIITADDVHEHNTFDDPEKVTLQKFENFAFNANKLKIKLPKCSVAGFTIKQ
ncbi:MAG: alpha-N-arabinofuranosidase [Ruminococcaceae bacterium]|nr:alpha-N-arabinofuranosidase [Oscillospiraceae bacterium]